MRHRETWRASRAAFLLWDLNRKKTEMTLTSKKVAATAATLFTFALFVMTASTAQADDYCITNGAQTAHGCGYQTMEACRAASSGIGGSCALNPSSKNPSDALGYQQKQPNSRIELHARKQPTGH